jgi:hypothetical protein
VDRTIAALSGIFTAVSIVFAFVSPSAQLRMWAIIAAIAFGLTCGTVLAWDVSAPVRRGVRWLIGRLPFVIRVERRGAKLKSEPPQQLSLPASPQPPGRPIPPTEAQLRAVLDRQLKSRPGPEPRFVPSEKPAPSRVQPEPSLVGFTDDPLLQHAVS